MLGGQADPKGERGPGPRRGSCRKRSFQETLKEDVYSVTPCGAGKPVLGIMGEEELRGGLEQHLNYCTKSSVLAKGPRELLWAPE